MASLSTFLGPQTAATTPLTSPSLRKAPFFRNLRCAVPGSSNAEHNGTYSKTLCNGTRPSLLLRASKRRTTWGHQAGGAARWRCSAAAGASAGSPADDENPFTVLGVNPLQGFDAAKVAHRKKTKDAERRGDEAAMLRLERAYDRIMMQQLQNRQKGLTYGSVKVSKDIKYADRKDWFPWRPRRAPVARRDRLINAGFAAAISMWMLSLGAADYKPLQVLLFASIFRIVIKLNDLQPAAAQPDYSAYDEEEGAPPPPKANGARLLRALGLSFGCVAAVSVAYTALLYLLRVAGVYTPKVLLFSQEIFVTIGSSILLYFIASDCR